MIEPSVAEFVASHRRATGLSQRALAERAGISAPALASVESGRSRRPRPALIRPLADALGVSPVTFGALSGQLDDGPVGRALERWAVGAWARATREDLGVWSAVALGAYFRLAREALGLTPAAAGRRFASRWGLTPCAPEAWAAVEGGKLPDGLIGELPAQSLQLVPGRWLWALGDAVRADPEFAFSLIGRLSSRWAAAVGVDMPRWMKTAWAVAARPAHPYVDVGVLAAEALRLREREMRGRSGVMRASDGTWQLTVPGDIPAATVQRAYDWLIQSKADSDP